MSFFHSLRLAKLSNKDPMQLLRAMDRENPYVFSPVFRTPRISPELQVNGLVTDSWQNVGGKHGASLGGIAIDRMSGKKVLHHSFTSDAFFMPAVSFTSDVV
jgi:hypothetical protein